VLRLDVADLDMPNRRARVRRKGGTIDWIVWQTGTARLLPRLLNGRTTGPVFLTDRKALVQLPPGDIDPATGRARLSYSHGEALFKAASGGATFAPTAPLCTDPRRRGRHVGPDADGPLRSHVSPVAGAVRPGFRRGAAAASGRARPGAAPLARRWREPGRPRAGLSLCRIVGARRRGRCGNGPATEKQADRRSINARACRLPPVQGKTSENLR
jgi:hypothetical protein